MPRIAVIDRDKCTNIICGYVCRKVCPVVRMGQDAVVVGSDDFPVIDEILCTGCGICPKKCPRGAIKIINLVEEAGDLLHQYGPNSFRVYNLPLPREGVTGLVGQNGIGKTTLVSILSGTTVPNFGKFSEKITLEEAVKKFKGKEAANYFQGLLKGMTAAKKIQNVESLRETGITVRTLLGVSKDFDAVVEKLGLSQVLDRDLSELSGGELQLAAIAATIIQEADFYFFDEPSSFLDVKQRLVVAGAIRELAEKARVMVVEHDLAVLDYLTDSVYILYGEKGAYGVASGPKSSRVGVNEYLDGYLKDENMRIRKGSIAFDIKGLIERGAGAVMLEYGAMKKSFSSFSLRSNKGEIHEGEIVGVLGPNATGKTTFIKLLAGIEKADEGEQPQRLKVSYKPQYISPEEGTVRDVLDRYSLDEAAFQELSKHFDIDEIMEKECSKLSGGELQRLAIAICLGQEADLYLLDEPSAFLDIEQRLELSSILRRRVGEGQAAFVVDHDVVLVDSISDRIVVFDGQSGVYGSAGSPKAKKEGMNSFLKAMGVTVRRDPQTGRPRINKFDSVLDREQKESGEYYYVGG